jgi:hypothetical protein
VLPIIASIQRSGITSLRGLAIALNNRGVPTARNGQWQVSNVRNVLRAAIPYSFKSGKIATGAAGTNGIDAG